jgi:FkbM family methyltransferase
MSTMDIKQREDLRRKILQRNEGYGYGPDGSRLKRSLRYPLRTLRYYGLQTVALRRPYKVNYTTLWGDRMRFYLPESGALYYNGFFEANLTNFFVNFLQDGDTFFDIGANVGYYSLLGSSLVGPRGKVLSFEPTPRTFASLSENVRSKDNIEVFNNAVLDREVEIEFFDYGPKYSPFNSVVKRTSEQMFFKDKFEAIRVKAIAIDTFCKTRQVFPTFAKIDVEGSEHFILEAMSTVLDEARPLVSIEVSAAEELNDNCRKSTSILLSKGYECFEISAPGYLTAHIPRDVYDDDNLLFVHPTRRGRIDHLIR